MPLGHTPKKIDLGVWKMWDLAPNLPPEEEQLLYRCSLVITNDFNMKERKKMFASRLFVEKANVFL